LTPSSSSSPRILSAPQSLFADAIDRISAAVSGARRAAGSVRLPHRQRALKPARCYRRRVSGWTIRSMFLQVGVMVASATNTIRSNRVPREGDRAFQHGELASQQGDLREQNPTRAKDIRHGVGKHEHSLEHGRAKLVPTSLNCPSIRAVVMTGSGLGTIVLSRNKLGTFVTRKSGDRIRYALLWCLSAARPRETNSSPPQGTPTHYRKATTDVAEPTSLQPCAT